jgi:hypothetical protein
MASGYSRTVQCVLTRGVAGFVSLPAPPRGEIERLIITQTAGAATAATINLYDRKGACIAATDLEVTAAGSVTGSANVGGFLQITTSADHGRIVGDRVELKNCTIATYNAVHTVTSVTATNQIVLSVSNTGAVATANTAPVLWQTAPLIPTKPPVLSLLLTDSVTAGTNKVMFDINRAYENRDNQSVSLRCRHSGLWLEFITAGTATSLTFEVAATFRADTIV